MSELHEDFVSFDKALRELQLRSEELKKLVSEGEIRAFRDGESMKFKREDIESLSAQDVEEELVFADALEDDTGMATEELSDEDTLLADVDLLDEEEPAPRARRRGVEKPMSARARVTETESSVEPAWVTAAVLLCTGLLIWGLLATFQIAAEMPPSGVTGLFASGG